MKLEASILENYGYSISKYSRIVRKGSAEEEEASLQNIKSNLDTYL